MSKDTCTRDFYSDPVRYADVINGILCDGERIVRPTDLKTVDGRTGRKARDLLYQAAFGVNFAVIGLENQEYIDYALPHRMMHYESGEYERQRIPIRKAVEKEYEGITGDEYLGRFRKTDHLYPQVNLCLYYGKEPWDGEKDLYGMLDLTGIPDKIRNKVQDYHTHVVEVRKLEDTSVFHTDVKQVFDFIRFSDDSEKLRALLQADPGFRNLAEDALEFISYYAKAEYLKECKKFQKKEGEKIDMCRALEIMFQEAREEGEKLGKELGKELGREQEKQSLIHNALSMKFSIDQITKLCNCSAEYVEQVMRNG